MTFLTRSRFVFVFPYGSIPKSLWSVLRTLNRSRSIHHCERKINFRFFFRRPHPCAVGATSLSENALNSVRLKIVHAASRMFQSAFEDVRLYGWKFSEQRSLRKFRPCRDQIQNYDFTVNQILRTFSSGWCRADTPIGHWPGQVRWEMGASARTLLPSSSVQESSKRAIFSRDAPSCSRQNENI